MSPTANFRVGDLSVNRAFDHDDELFLALDDAGVYLKRVEVTALRDHLTAVLGEDVPHLGDPARLTQVPTEAPGMSRAEALKLAEETVTRLAPATNARGYADGTAPLTDRVNAILRTAAYLMKETQ